MNWPVLFGVQPPRTVPQGNFSTGAFSLHAFAMVRCDDLRDYIASDAALYAIQLPKHSMCCRGTQMLA